MGLRNYANAPGTVLSVGCTATDTVLNADADPGFPAPPFTLIVDQGQATEEVVLCTSKSSGAFTVTRGWDSTTTYTHSQGASLVHGISAIDPREANSHVNASANVHGVSGDLVGTDETQTLSNKTLTSPQVNSATVHAATINTSNITDQCVIFPNPDSSSVPLFIYDSTGATVGSISRAGVIQGPQFVSGQGNDWAGFIAYASADQLASGFVVRRPDNTVLGGIDGDGKIFGGNMFPGTSTVAPFWYGSKTDVDHLPAAAWEKIESYSVDNSAGAGWSYANGYLTVPAAGRYHITASAGFAGNANGSRGIRVRYQNAVGATSEFIRQLVPAGTAADCALSVSVSKTIPDGGQVFVELFQSSGGTLDGGGGVSGPCILQCEWLGV